MHVRYPVWLHRVATPGAAVFALMFAIESLARASLATVIPLQALDLMGDARDVSLAYTGVGIVGLGTSFLIPLLIRRIRRRWTYTLGAVLLIVTAGLLNTVTLPGQVIGMLVRVFATACLNISLSLYVMDYIRRQDFVRSEPLRLQVSALAWTAGPALGVFLYAGIGPWAAYGLSAACAMLLLGYFWFLRLQENPTVAAATKPAPSPLKSIGRFVAQPRLQLAWLIAFGRSTWWVLFFIYAPLYMIETGHSETTGSLVVSAGNAMLFLTPLFGQLGWRFGIRRVLVVAFIAAGGGFVLAGGFYDMPPLAATWLIVGSFATVALDALGGIPFLRAVRAYERPQMTTVYRTYGDASELIPPAVCALILTFTDIRGVFIVAGIAVIGVIYWVRHLPARM